MVWVKTMVILFVGAKDYDCIWFEKYANEKGYIVNFLKDKTELTQLKGYKADILCIPYKEIFSAEEIKILKQMDIKALLLRTGADYYGNKKGFLYDIPVFEILEYSPSVFV